MEKALTAETLRQYLDYDAATGLFTRRVTRKGGARAGDVAGTLSLGYVRIQLNGGFYMAHRLAWLWVYGHWPSKHLDHINRIKSDNRIANLREVSRSENMQNTSLSVNNTSGYRGVSYFKQTGKWQAYIATNRKLHHLGLFESPESASAAYQEAAARLHSHRPGA